MSAASRFRDLEEPIAVGLAVLVLVVPLATACGGALSSSMPSTATVPPTPDPVVVQSPPPPPDVVSRPAATQLALTDSATCALSAEGALQCWGKLGTLSDREMDSRPRSVSLGRGLARIAATRDELCALSTDGNLVCAPLGDAVFDVAGELASAPLAPIALPGVAAELAAGGASICVRLADGRVACTGVLAHPSGTTCTIDSEERPCTRDIRMVDGIANATAIAMGAVHACALIDDGSVRCWGTNTGVALGSLGAPEDGTPVVVSGVSDAVAIAAGTRFTCAALRDGHVVCWGNVPEWYGSGIDVDAEAHALVRMPLPELEGATSLNARHETICGVVGGHVRCVAPPPAPPRTPNRVRGHVVPFVRPPGQPIGLPGHYFPPVLRREFPGATSIALSWMHACVTSTDGAVGCFGWNETGVVGDPWVEGAVNPVPVLDATFRPVRDDERVRELPPETAVAPYTAVHYDFDTLSLETLRTGAIEPSPTSYRTRVRATLANRGDAIRACLAGHDGAVEFVMTVALAPRVDRPTSVATFAVELDEDERSCISSVARETAWPTEVNGVDLRLPIGP